MGTNIGPGTVGEFIRYRWPSSRKNKYLPWPPDSFAIAAALLKHTGTYKLILDIGPSPRNFHNSEEWRKDVIEAGLAWRRRLNKQLKNDVSIGPTGQAIPPRVRSEWKTLMSHASLPVSELEESEAVVRALITICVVADVASAGIGLYKIGGEPDAFMRRAFFVNGVLNERQSFCHEIECLKLRVMPKLHTPQRGLTVRSLTHNLALIEGSELRMDWWQPLQTNESLNILNLLLLPWPTKVTPSQFSLSKPTSKQTPYLPDDHSFFSYSPNGSSGKQFKDDLANVVERAKSYVDRIHGFVFPELALDDKAFEHAENVAVAERAVLVSGVHMVENGLERNAAVVQPLGFSNSHDTDSGARKEFRIVQTKHHRWCLDRNQIIRYGLGGRLPASKDCWEGISLGQRQLNFFTFGDWLTWTVLVCEDLARQDPVANALRTVAPGLVIALLMDGPQLSSRWSSRYASVLAEDPGSSVLTLTSLGMSNLSRVRLGKGERDRRRTIALWRDAMYGEKEIELDPDADACVLSLVCKRDEEFTADGRGDGNTAYFPVFAGVHQIKK